MPKAHIWYAICRQDTVLYCSAKSSTDLQQMLNEDLACVAEWLNDHKRTLNVDNWELTKAKVLREI